MIVIDGSNGEGGGQIVRTSLALSLITGQPFRIENVRAGREKPGLRRQHLTAIQAAAEIGQARVCDAAVGARSFSFFPGRVVAGNYKFSIGTAGSTTLVLQTVLPPLMLASASSHLILEGGTHNPKAPPFEFIAETFLPVINRLGPHIDVQLDRYGFYPPGGGRFQVTIDASPQLRWQDLVEQGELRSRRATALVVNLPKSVGDREIAVVRDALGWSEEECEVEMSHNAASPGNVLMLRISSELVNEVVSSIGERGLRAEAVAQMAIAEARSYLDSGAPVGQHLADQLLVQLALAGRGKFVTGPPSLHTTTNIDVIRHFLNVDIRIRPLDDGRFSVSLNC